MPRYLWRFIGRVALISLGALSPAIHSTANDVSRACLVMAIAALGLKPRCRELALPGWRPLALFRVETAWIARIVLAVGIGVR